MAKISSPLAKLTRPRLHGAVARERLFARLDEARAHKSAVCVVGPPGAGKTTLVGSWLDARKAPGLWYQVDAGDADVATFFYYLNEAALAQAGPDQAALPLLTTEYQHDIGSFSRRFFRALFALLPRGSVLVLDNYQEVDAGQPYHELIAQAVAEIPPGCTLVVISRRDPPDCYARLVANEDVAFVDWADLKLSFEEARAIIGARLQDAGEAVARRLFEDCGGWAAGLTLLVDNYRRHGPVAASLPAERDAVFRYFAAQVFDRLPQPTREFLMATALLPQVPVSLARDLTGNADTDAILDDLYRRHLFTHRRPAAEPTYWYHALFREFLQDQARTLSDENQRRETVRRAARLLEARLDFDAAFQLFLGAADWPAACRLIERHAQVLLAQGRGQTLRDWVLVLPDSIIESAPWVRYWLGTSLLSHDQKQARGHLERAFGQFAADGETMGQALAAAGMIESYFFEWSDFHPMRRWVDTLDPLLGRLNFSGDPTRERRIYSSLLVGILYVAPNHRLRGEVVARVTEMLDENMDVNSKATTAMMLMSYSNLACDMDRARRAVDCIEGLIEHEDVTPFNRLWCNLRMGYYYPIVGNYAKGRETLDRAAQISEEYGLQSLRRVSLLIGSYQVSCYGMLGDIRSMRKWQSRNAELSEASRPMDAWHVVQSRVHLDATAGQYVSALEGARRTTEIADRAGMTYIKVLGAEHAAGLAALIGDRIALTEMLDLLRSLTAGTCFAFFECQARLYEIFHELVHGDADRGRRMLPDFIRFARATDLQYVQMARYTPISGTVLAEALRTGVEIDYVRETIRRFGIRAPADAPESWPWPVKVFTLGRFEILCEDQKLEFPGKAPRKVLAVLKAIVAGGGEPVAIARMADALWPDEEGDAARKAFDVALVRLRRLLGNAEAVIVRDEQVSLSREVCWVDAWTFARNVEMVERGDAVPQALLRVGRHAMETYRGGFLPSSDEDKAIVVMRLKLRDLFARLVSELGRQLEEAGEWESALAYYRRGIDADELAEEFYQGVMRCHATMGRPAEGIAAFRRLRQTLSVVLGVKPSEKSEQLMQLLGRAGSGQSS